MAGASVAVVSVMAAATRPRAGRAGSKRRRWSAEEAQAEALRMGLVWDHVESPCDPIVIFLREDFVLPQSEAEGMDENQARLAGAAGFVAHCEKLRAEHEAATGIKHKDDEMLCAYAVSSHPVSMTEVWADKTGATLAWCMGYALRQAQEWREESIEATGADRLVAVVVHLDEGQFHCHGFYEPYPVPEMGGKMHVGALDPGNFAFACERKRLTAIGGLSGEEVRIGANAARDAAMVARLDRHFDRLGSKEGWSRKGPKTSASVRKARINAVWHREQQAERDELADKRAQAGVAGERLDLKTREGIMNSAWQIEAENIEAQAMENAELKEKLAASDSRARAWESKAIKLESENSHIKEQMALVVAQLKARELDRAMGHPNYKHAPKLTPEDQVKDS